MWSEGKSLSHVWLFAIPWTVPYKAPLFLEFSRQEYWSGLPVPSPGIFPTQGSNPGHPHWRQTLYSVSQQGSCVPNNHLPSLAPDDTRPLDRHSPRAFPELLPCLGSDDLGWPHLGPPGRYSLAPPLSSSSMSSRWCVRHRKETETDGLLSSGLHSVDNRGSHVEEMYSTHIRETPKSQTKFTDKDRRGALMTSVYHTQSLLPFLQLLFYTRVADKIQTFI